MQKQAVQREIILGVDTHLDLHVGAVIDVTGKLLGTLSTVTTAGGYQQLIAWARSLGLLLRAGVEGTGTYGTGLARALREQGIEVLEVNRPDRSKRRLVGKSDPIDAESAARSVLSGQATAIPKSHEGVAEALRTISVARRSELRQRPKLSTSCGQYWKVPQKKSEVASGKSRLNTVSPIVQIFVRSAQQRF